MLRKQQIVNHQKFDLILHFHEFACVTVYRSLFIKLLYNIYKHTYVTIKHKCIIHTSLYILITDMEGPKSKWMCKQMEL